MEKSSVADIREKMNSLYNIFSTREIALAIWFLVFLIFISRTKEVRQSIIRIIKAIFAKRFILTFSTMLLYILIVIILLSYIRFWDVSLLKDTILWILFSGVVLFMNSDKVESVDYFVNYFSKLIKDNIKIVVVWEFLVNLYIFSLSWELILIPVVFLFTIAETLFPKQGKSYENVAPFGKNVLGLIGLVVVGYVVYRTIAEYEHLFSISNIKSLLLPVLLVILTLPYFYALALYTNYRSFINVVKHLHRNEKPEISKGLIKATLKYANINLNTLKRIWKYQVHFDSSEGDPDEYIRSVARKPKYIISDKAKLRQFNDIRTVINNLSNIGIGKLDEWHKSYAGDDYYLSMTNYYQFGIDNITKIPNTLAIYLTGGETYIKQLEIVLDIGPGQDRSHTIEKFMEILKQTFSCLDIRLPNSLTDSIIENKEYDQQYETHTVSLSYEKYKRMGKYVLRVITQ